MYLTNIKIENIGPIARLDLKLQAPKGRAPLPLVFVGTNGSGKSLVLAQIASALINAHNSTFEDSDTDKGRLFKLMHRSYIRHGSNYSYSDLRFTDGIFEREIILDRPKKDFEKILELPFADEWQQLGPFEGVKQVTDSRPDRERLQRAFIGPHIYFPPNRFEDPAWVNERDLRNKIEYPYIERMSGLSNRKIIEYTPMKNNQSWILDLLYESHTVERKSVLSVDGNQHIEQTGPATYLMDQIQKFILILFGTTGKPTWHLGRRSSRTISLVSDDRTVIKNLLALSTGESLVLDLFLTILRHADLSLPQINKLEEIKGLVVIDEVDLHLHAEFQFGILPKLFSMFPNIQFIMSSHSPLFLLGLEKENGEDGSIIVELPSGSCISAERFSEFKSAYNQISMTSKYETEIRQRVLDSVKHQLYVEGETDRLFIERAAELLNETELLSKFDIQIGNGVGGLNKIWKALKIYQRKDLERTVILLYDHDANIKNNCAGGIFQRSIPPRGGPIRSGIENLFEGCTIDRVVKHNIRFIDSVIEKNRTRGKSSVEPEKLSVNPDEKRNLCDWLCKNGNAEDFKHFDSVFGILHDCLSAYLSKCSELQT